MTPADRPSRRPGPVPDGSAQRSDGGSAQDRAGGMVPGRGPGPGPKEMYHPSDGERAQTRSEVGNPRGGSAPTRVEHAFPEGTALRGRGGDAGNRRARHALTRAERFSFAGGQGPGRRPGGKNWESGESDEELHARQMAGINALISIANIDSVAYDRQVDGIRALISIANDVATTSRQPIYSPTGEIRKQSRLSVISKLRKDEMTWNSLFLILNTGLMAGSGFLFWIVTTHLFSAPDVGKGSALITGASTIAQLALLGLNVGINRFLPTARNRNALISSGLALVASAGALGAIVYILLAPLVAPALAFVGKNLLLTIGFAGVTGAIAVNTLTDNIFIALRKAKYTVLVDGVIGGFGKIAVAFVVAGAGAYGLFLASSIALVLATTASLLLIFVVMRVRFDLRKPLRALKPLLRFSGANYLGNLIYATIGLANTVILLDRLGAASTGYYFVVLQLTQIMYTATMALEQTFLTEGSQADADIPQLRRRALRLLVIFFVASATIMIGIGRWLLLAFGRPYYEHGYVILIILVLAAGPTSLNLWFQTILRLAGKLRAIVVVNATGAILGCAGIWFGSSFGLTGVACCSVAAALITSSITGVAALGRRA